MSRVTQAVWNWEDLRDIYEVLPSPPLQGLAGPVPLVLPYTEPLEWQPPSVPTVSLSSFYSVRCSRSLQNMGEILSCSYLRAWASPLSLSLPLLRGLADGQCP